MSRDTWSPQDKLTDSKSWLYRMPLDGGRPQAAAVLGAPIDQYSFREDPDAGRIDVLTFTWGPGDAMFGADYPSGQAALLKLPFARFGDGTAQPVLEDYRALPILPKSFRQIRNRFVGDELLYSAVLDNRPIAERDEVTPERESLLTVVPLDDRPIRRFVLAGKISRIEEMGLDAVVVASDEDATFTTVALTGPRPVISDQFVLAGSEEAEDRSHAFFYRPDPDSPDGATGLLGLPVITRDENDDDIERASIAYLRRGTGRLRSVGALAARPLPGRVDDGCVASCHDWYGDARPIFFGARIFGLLGYEIVEGVERDERIRETRRIDLTPPTPAGPRPYYRY